MRRVSKAIWTSGEPVSVSERLCSWMTWDFCSFTNVMCSCQRLSQGFFHAPHPSW